MGQSNTTPRLSIVVPMFDEEENVEPLCAAVRDALDGRGVDYEVVIVDDGSRDGTPAALTRAARADRRVRPLLLRRNRGQTAAMSVGFSRCRGSVIVSMDGDLQNDPRDIPSLLAKMDEGYDVVCGWRRERKDNWLVRTLPSKIANRMIAALTGIAIHDNGCSLKAYRASVIQSITLYSEMHRFLPAMSSLTGARIAEVVVRHHPRLHGRSKYGLARTLKVLSDMFAIKAITQFGQRPALCFGALAAPCFAVAGLALAVWLLSPGAQSSVVFSSLAVIAAFLGGHMLALAVLGELFLIYDDRRYLRRLVRALAADRPRGSGHE